MKRAGKPKKRKVTFSNKEYDEVRQIITTDATSKAVLVTIAAVNKVIPLTDDQICDIVVEFNKIADDVDNNTLDMIKIQKLIEDNTGIRFRGW